MSRDIWNPRQYRAYASHRARPFYELLARVDVEAPAYVVDLGCGPGERTVDLTTRWPDAVIEGIDSSVQMISEARRMAAERAQPRLTGSLPVEGGPAATEVPDAEPRLSPAPEAPAASPSTPAAETSPDYSTRGATSAGPERMADSSIGGAAPGSLAGVAGRSTGDAAPAGPARVNDSSTDDAASAGPARIADPSIGGAAPASPAQIADSSTDDAGAVGESVPPPVGSGMSPDFAAGALAAVEGGSRDRVGGAVRAGGSSPGFPEGGHGGGELRFSVGDLAEWTPDRPVDVIFSNAAFQWVPEHRELLPRWVAALAPGGRLAFSMPGNFDAPSHRILRELCESPRWRDRLGQVNRHNVVGDPADYFELLSDLGCEVDAWETTYVQVLHGPDPVLEWMKGTALRPAFDALPDEAEREEFVAELTTLLREAYPPGPHGTLFPFRRIFVIAGPAMSASAPS